MDTQGGGIDPELGLQRPGLWSQGGGAWGGCLTRTGEQDLGDRGRAGLGQQRLLALESKCSEVM